MLLPLVLCPLVPVPSASQSVSSVALDKAPREVAGGALDASGSNKADGVVIAERLAFESRVPVDWIGPAWTKLTEWSEFGPFVSESLIVSDCLQILSNQAFSLP